MKKAIHTGILTLLLLLFTFSGAFALTLSPSEARTTSTGSTVTVSGYAFSATDTNNAGFINEFYLSDLGARGIIVVPSKNESITLYKEYSVTGTITKSDGELKIQNATVTPLSSLGSRKFLRLTFKEALDYDTNGGTFTRLSGKATNPVFTNGALSSFVLVKGTDSIRVVIPENVLSLSNGKEGKTELSELLKYKINVTVDGFVATKNGETFIRIKDCDDIDVQYHKCVFGESVTEISPSCGKEGLAVRICECGRREETPLSSLSHSFYDVTEQKASCSQTGLQVKKCRNCDFREETVLPKTEHSYRERTEREPTCTLEGIRVRYCANCLFREEASIEKKNHSYAENTETKATCYSEGVYVRYCKTCDFREETVLPKTEHSYRERTEREPTCTLEGIRVRYCYYCSFREESLIEKKAHSYAEKTETKPSCTSEGVYVKYCKTCDFREETALPKAEHSYKETETKKATCTEEGYTIKTCTSCKDESKTLIPKLSHIYETKTEKASFTKDGYTCEQCTLCDHKRNTVIIPAANCLLSEESFVYDGKTHSPTVTVIDKDKNPITDFTLICKPQKEIGKHSLTVELMGNYSGKKTLYYTIVPKDISNIKTSVVSKDATFSFTESEGADGYRIYYMNGTKAESLGTFSSVPFSVTLPGYAKAYTVIIKAYKKTADATLWSEGVRLSVSTAPGKVTGIKTESTYYSVTLKWNKTEGADGYRVYVQNSKGKYKILTTTSKTTFTAVGLSGGSKYSFAVKPYRKAEGKTLWGNSTKKTVETPSAKPSSISATPDYYSVKLSWKKVTGADGYKVYVYSSKKKKYVTLKALRGNTFTAEDLNSGTTYKFAVKPYAKKSTKTYYGKAVYITVTTKLTKPVLTVTPQKNGTNKISFKKVNGADGYEIYYCYEKGGKMKKLKTLTSASFTHKPTLKVCYYKVRAYKTVDGKKIYSSFSTVKKATN